ncbi:MAG TPA: hypothetical protein VD813_14910 [Pseudonocardia sp.]|nr:hypothetical protein [Pseudonocardia sp.]
MGRHRRGTSTSELPVAHLMRRPSPGVGRHARTGLAVGGVVVGAITGIVFVVGDGDAATGPGQDEGAVAAPGGPAAPGPEASLPPVTSAPLTLPTPDSSVVTQVGSVPEGIADVVPVAPADGSAIAAELFAEVASSSLPAPDTGPREGERGPEHAHPTTLPGPQVTAAVPASAPAGATSTSTYAVSESSATATAASVEPDGAEGREPAMSRVAAWTPSEEDRARGHERRDGHSASARRTTDAPPGLARQDRRPPGHERAAGHGAGQPGPGEPGRG